jgi:hypothetical protein
MSRVSLPQIEMQNKNPGNVQLALCFNRTCPQKDKCIRHKDRTKNEEEKEVKEQYNAQYRFCYSFLGRSY